MKVKKLLKNKVSEQHQKILENNKDFYESITERYSKKPSKSHLLRRVGILAACGISVAIALCAIFNPGHLMNNQKHYLEENKIATKSNVESLSADLKTLKLVLPENCSVSLMKDSVSQDKLYYYLYYDVYETIETIKISAVINPDYELFWKFKTEPTSIMVNGLQILYCEERIADEELNNFVVKAKIVAGSEELYLDYDHFTFESVSNFQNFVKETFHLK